MIQQLEDVINYIITHHLMTLSSLFLILSDPFPAPQISSYLSKASKAYTTLRVKIPTETENKLSVEKLKARIAELTS
jgi:hypothetical protein